MTVAIEFWRLKTVVQRVGLSKTEIYRKVAKGEFPPSHPYPDNPKIRFWFSNDVLAWQQRIIAQVRPEMVNTAAASAFEDLLG